MKKFYTFFVALLCAFVGVQMAAAQTVEFRGVKNHMRYDDGDDTKYEYVGWDSETQTAVFLGDVGTWQMHLNGTTLTDNLEHYDNLMYGNSGAIYVNGKIFTVFSHQDPDPEALDGEMEFVVRKWDAETFELLESKTFPKSANIESRGMTYCPQDGKVYGLFYLTDVTLPVGEDQLDEEDRQEGYTTDAGYAICTIDLNTMELTQITPGIYYDNFVTLACSPEGRLYSMTSGGTMVEFSRETGLIKSKQEIVGGEVTYTNFYDHSGVVSQFKRQAACFDFNTGKMYWNGFVNSGMGYNDWGSYGPLSDKEWRTNGKYDTALYEVNIETGAATKIANIPLRLTFSCLWVVGADGTETYTALDNIHMADDAAVKVYNIQGQEVDIHTPGFVIVKKGNKVEKYLQF